MKACLLLHSVFYFGFAGAVIASDNVNLTALPKTAEHTINLDVSDSLRGVDVDDSGVRDDIELYIQIQDISEQQKVWMTSYAQYVQAAIEANSSITSSLRSISTLKAQAQICLLQSFDDRTVSQLYARRIEQYSTNTYIRYLQYERYNKARSGASLALPSTDNCI